MTKLHEQQLKQTLERLKSQKWGYWEVIGDEILPSRRVLAKCTGPDCDNEPVVITHTNLTSGKAVGCNKCAAKKRKETSLARFGTENPMQSDVIKEKIKKTSMERYGVENHLFTKDSRDKIAATNLSRYGHANVGSAPEIQSKMKATNLERYGHEYVFGSEEIQEKSKTTWLQKYGVDHIGKNLDSHIKRYKNVNNGTYTSSFEKEVVEFIYSLGFETRKTALYGRDNAAIYEIDIEIIGTNLYIECNGDYWHCDKRIKNPNYHKIKSVLVNKQLGGHLIHIFETEWKNNKKEFIELIERYLHKNNKPYFEAFYSESSKELKLLRFSDFQTLKEECDSLRNKHGEFFLTIDLRKEDLKSYESTGFSVVEENDPDYWYYDTKKRVIIKKDSTRTFEVSATVFKTWDCGSAKLIYK